MSFYSTLLLLPSRCYPGFILLRLLVSQVDQSLLVFDLKSFRVAVICIPENNTQDIPIFFLFMFLSVCEIYVHVTKCGAWDVFHLCGV